MSKPWLDERLAANDLSVRENFMCWFKDSAVIDAQGQPLVVFHGTPHGGFVEFSTYTKGSRTNHDSADVGFHFTDSPSYAEAYSEGYKLESIETYRSLFGSEPQAIRMPPGSAIYPVFLCIQNPMEVDKSFKIDARLIQAAKAGGHDGIVANMGGAREFVVFEPSQIKSATGNCGLYLEGSSSLTDFEFQHALLQARKAREMASHLSASPPFVVSP